MPGENLHELELASKLTFSGKRWKKSLVEEGAWAGNYLTTLTTHRTDGSEIEEYKFYEKPRKDRLRHHSAEATKKEYHRCLSYWKDSNGQWKDCDWLRKLISLFESAMDESSGLQVTQVVCLGLGTFGYFQVISDNGSPTNPAHRSCSYHQLIALELYIELLNSHQKNSIIKSSDVYFQDPAFEKVDEEFLSSKGFTVVPDPDAYNKMTSTTFLYAPYCPWMFVFNAFVVERPVLFMGLTYDMFLRSISSVSPQLDLACVHQFHRSWSSTDLPYEILADGEKEALLLCHILYWKPNPGIDVTKRTPGWVAFSDEQWDVFYSQGLEEFDQLECVEQQKSDGGMCCENCKEISLLEGKRGRNSEAYAGYEAREEGRVGWLKKSLEVALSFLPF